MLDRATGRNESPRGSRLRGLQGLWLLPLLVLIESSLAQTVSPPPSSSPPPTTSPSPGPSMLTASSPPPPSTPPSPQPRKAPSPGSMPATSSALPPQLDSLTVELQRRAMGMSCSRAGIAGPGAAFLLDRARRAEFVLVGEDHGIAEIPQFCAGLAESLSSTGFSALAVECGPEAAHLMSSLLREPDPSASFRQFDHEYPWTFPFFNWAEEVEMLERVRRSGMALWGLDQEFILGTPYYFSRLSDLAAGKEAKQLAEEYRERAREADREVVTRSDPSRIYLLAMTAADFDRLERAFARESLEAKRLLTELRASWDIYGKDSRNEGRAANRARSLLMKRRLHEELPDGSKARVMFKFGANHAMRGRSLIGVYDLGNHVTELADARGGESFHILILAVSGASNAYRAFTKDPAAKAEPYDLVAGLEGLVDARPLVAAARQDEWTVIDLVSVRRKLRELGGVDRGMDLLIWGYDALVLIPGATPSTLLN